MKPGHRIEINAENGIMTLIKDNKAVDTERHPSYIDPDVQFVANDFHRKIPGTTVETNYDPYGNLYPNPDTVLVWPPQNPQNSNPNNNP